MPHVWSLKDIHLNDTWLTIGSFDGVHKGHQSILQNLTTGAHAAGAPAVVLTFFPHPAVVLGKRKDPFYLTSPEEKAELLLGLGADLVITHPFDSEVAHIPAREFMAILQEHLGIRQLWVGPDFALGRGREGTVPVLAEIGKDMGFVVNTIGPITNGGEIISSSRIRAAIAAGEVQQAAALLGRAYRVSGKVIEGDGRGRTLGIPTANLDLWHERAIPKAGVYVCKSWANGKEWGAVANVGVRPTFELEPVPPRVEAHLFDFDQDLYGKTISLDFLARLRDEKRFASVEALIDQIHADMQAARGFLSQPS